MTISNIETIWFQALSEAQWRKQNPNSRQALPNSLWVQIHTDEELEGLGETYYLLRAAAAVIHDVLALMLIGRDPLDIENHWNNMFSVVNVCGHAGSEMRGISAVDIARWDLAGQHTGQPIYNLLGGRNRDRKKIYNACVSSDKYDDLDAWCEGRAGQLAESLLRQGIKAMNLWPFDQFGPTLSGTEMPPFCSAHGFAGGVLATRARLPHWQEVGA